MLLDPFSIILLSFHSLRPLILPSLLEDEAGEEWKGGRVGMCVSERVAVTCYFPCDELEFPGILTAASSEFRHIFREIFIETVLSPMQVNQRVLQSPSQ